MKKLLWIVVLGLLCFNTTFAADNIKPKKTPLKKLSKQLGNGELVKIQSYQAANYKAIKEGWYKESPIKVEALLTFPDGKGPFPVLLLVHSSGGAKEFTEDYLEFMRDQQKPLLDMGIATMYLDNFSARGTKNTYRDQSKASIWSTYVDALQDDIFSKTGRVHTSFNQTIAATGRLSSSNPNLQNIPIRTEMGREIRKAFVVEGNNHLLSADYSQVELRVLAHLSEDEALVDAFQMGEDIHTRTACEIFGTSPERLDAEARRMAKAVNFGIVYGLSAFGLSKQLKIYPKDAKKFIDQYFALYKKVKVYMEETVAQAKEVGYTLTIMNRKRYLPDLKSQNRQVRESAERIAINSPVQGSAADLIKLAMIQLTEQIRKQKLKSRMILQVHDELVFECPENEEQKMRALIKKEMEEVVPLKVPLVVDIGWGKNWNTAH